MNNINQKVTITSLYFQNKKHLREYPRRMEWAGESYTFDSGLACDVQRGSSIFRIYQMTDGRKDFRLRFDAGEGSWTLLGVSI
ncbi:MAG TPA: hypothetical protein VNG90_01960 [Candidatus Acidoferrum sp.]|nr:hypothetical protein [Candidatus Acidoferrum sp.]